MWKKYCFENNDLSLPSYGNMHLSKHTEIYLLQNNKKNYSDKFFFKI